MWRGLAYLLRPPSDIVLALLFPYLRVSLQSTLDLKSLQVAALAQ